MEIKIDLTHLLNEDDTQKTDVSFQIDKLDDDLNYHFDVNETGFTLVISKETL